MKNRLILLGVAVAALTSCAKEEVTDVAQNRAIRFSQFVNNNTRSVVEVETDNLTQYYVFGESGETKGTYGTKNFDNELHTTPYYWIAGKYYSFGAYANGNGGKIENATFNANDGKLTFSNYTVTDDTKDLVAAVTKPSGPATGNNDPTVSLTFKHLLSQVKFTFKTTDATSYTLAISDLKLHAAKTGTCEYNGTAVWTSNHNDTEIYKYDNITDVSKDDYEAQSKLVIPQKGTDQLKVTFTAQITGAGLNEQANFETTLEVPANIAGTDSEANTWMPGYRYNYTATINADDIKEDLNKIEFNVTVDDWENATEQPIDPQKPTPIP